MERLDNPAGRLHAALTAFEVLSGQGLSVRDAWCQVLGVEGDDLWGVLGEVAGLIPRIERALHASENADQVEAFRHWQTTWARPIFAPDRPFDSDSQGLVETGALHALFGMSSLLSKTASEGFVPDKEVVKSLRAKLDEALHELAWGIDLQLPTELRQILNRRLHEMIWALDHVRLVGPDGVHAAAERLASNLSMESQEERNRPGVKAVIAAVGAVWAAFHSLPAVRDSIAAGQEILKMLGG
jgi:hypothetical protein